MIESNLFTTDIFEFYLKKDSGALEYIKKALSLIYVQEKYRGNNCSNVGGYQSIKNLHEHEQFKLFTEFIEKTAVDILKHKNHTDRFIPKVNSMWINVNPKHSFNHLHVHSSESWYSGILWVNCPSEQGNFMIQDPRQIKIPSIYNSMLNESEMVYLIPKEGNIIFFPSWVTHGINQNMSDEPQMCIAFMLDLIENNGKS